MGFLSDLFKRFGEATPGVVAAAQQDPTFSGVANGFGGLLARVLNSNPQLTNSISGVAPSGSGLGGFGFAGGAPSPTPVPRNPKSILQPDAAPIDLPTRQALGDLGVGGDSELRRVGIEGAAHQQEIADKLRAMFGDRFDGRFDADHMGALNAIMAHENNAARMMGDAGSLIPPTLPPVELPPPPPPAPAPAPAPADGGTSVTPTLGGISLTPPPSTAPAPAPTATAPAPAPSSSSPSGGVTNLYSYYYPYLNPAYTPTPTYSFTPTTSQSAPLTPEEQQFLQQIQAASQYYSQPTFTYSPVQYDPVTGTQYLRSLAGL